MQTEQNQPPVLGGEPEAWTVEDPRSPECSVDVVSYSDHRAQVARLVADNERLDQALRRERNDHCSTVNARDCAEQYADEIAQAIGKFFRVDVGEHSNLNCPWGAALGVLSGAYETDSDVERERDTLLTKCAELDAGLRAIAVRRMTPADARLLAKQHLNRAASVGAKTPAPAACRTPANQQCPGDGAGACDKCQDTPETLGDQQ